MKQIKMILLLILSASLSLSAQEKLKLTIDEALNIGLKKQQKPADFAA